MLQSQLFTKTRKELPKDESFRNAALLIQAGYIYKEMAGVYVFLPLGLRVLRKIENIIRSEMQQIGAQELLMTALQNPVSWRKSGRWEEAGGVWFKTRLANGRELGLGWTHEEPLTNLMRQYISSYQDLPQYVYQFQTKFRNELRPKSGLLRGREFLMKDLYSFHQALQDLDEFYERVALAYQSIFKRVGIGGQTYRTFASGGAFSRFSDEFQALASAGEDTIYLAKDQGIAINKEIYNQQVLKELGLEGAKFTEHRAIEVGNIFKLGDRFSSALGLVFKDKQGRERPVIMGSYGIGLGRLMATVVEVHNDSKGIIWPKSIAPFRVHLLALGQGAVLKKALKLYDILNKIIPDEVLLDDRQDITSGEKLVEADLLGMPWRVVVSEKTIKQGKIELKARAQEKGQFVSQEELIHLVQDN